MTARERILVIRLLEKVDRYPNYAKALGIEASGAKQSQKE